MNETIKRPNVAERGPAKEDLVGLDLAPLNFLDLPSTVLVGSSHSWLKIVCCAYYVQVLHSRYTVRPYMSCLAGASLVALTRSPGFAVTRKLLQSSTRVSMRQRLAQREMPAAAACYAHANLLRVDPSALQQHT